MFVVLLASIVFAEHLGDPRVSDWVAQKASIFFYFEHTFLVWFDCVMGYKRALVTIPFEYGCFIFFYTCP